MPLQFSDIGVEALNQHHAAVRQHNDVELMVKHLTKNKVFQFSKDQHSDHALIDLYRHGLHSLAGKSGAHAKHLAKHKLRLRSRHGLTTDTYQSIYNSQLTANDHHELDPGSIEFTLDSDEDYGDENKMDDLEEEEDDAHNEIGMNVE